MAALHAYTNFGWTCFYVVYRNLTETGNFAAHLPCTKATLHHLSEEFSFPHLHNLVGTNFSKVLQSLLGLSQKLKFDESCPLINEINSLYLNQKRIRRTHHYAVCSIEFQRVSSIHNELYILRASADKQSITFQLVDRERGPAVTFLVITILKITRAQWILLCSQ